jgi:hypothetical protein
MKNILEMKALGLLFVSVFLGASGAEAVQVSSLLNGASPTWNRITDRPGFPDSVNNGLPYQLLEIKSTSSTILTATITSPTQFDSFLALYSSSGFVPGSPNSNLLAADDDSGTYPHASLSKNGLATNTSYYLVVTSYSNQVGSVYPLTGNYTLNLSGDWRVVAPNFSPYLGGVFTTNGAISDTATTNPFSGVTVSDANSDTLSLTIAYTAANGTLTGTGLAGSAGNYTLTGSPVTVTSNLQGLLFHPTINQVAPGSTMVTNFTLTPSDGGGNGTSDNTSKVTVTSLNDGPTNSVLPAISGMALVSGLLTATSGTWSDVDPGASLSYSYQWHRATDGSGTNAAAIGGATGNSRTLTTADAHKYLRVTVTANDGQGSSTQSASSAWTAVSNSGPANAALPVISGLVVMGGAITGSSGTWNDADGDALSYSYQWYRATDGAGTGATAIPAATTSGYTVASPDAHKYLRVKVTANDGEGGSQSAGSSWTQVANTAPSFTDSPAVSGNSLVGQVLSLIGTATSDPDGDTVNLSYQWQSDGNAITGATGATYQLTPGEAGKSVTCQVTADDGQGAPNSQVSVTTGGVSVMGVAIGAYRAGEWFLDLNSNGSWEDGVDGYGYFGASDMVPVPADWNGDGYTEAAVYRAGHWYFDTSGNDQWDGETTDLWVADYGEATDIPVVGDWNGDGLPEIGIYRPGNSTWYLDTDRSFTYDPAVDVAATFGFAGALPVVGDWDGNGQVKIGVYFEGQWYLDLNGNRAWDGAGTDRYVSAFGAAGMAPVVGDWNGSGSARIGAYRDGGWYLDLDGNGTWDPATDKYLGSFGVNGMIPLVGRW